jgi:sec-independent protein translocase protein TatA
MFDSKMLLVILAIALVIFGTKRLRTIGSDLGAAVKGFKSAMSEGETEEKAKQLKQDKDADFTPSTAAPSAAAPSAAARESDAKVPPKTQA